MKCIELIPATSISTSMDWRNIEKESGPKLLHTTVRDWYSDTKNNYFTLMLLKVVLQATESECVLSFTHTDSAFMLFLSNKHDLMSHDYI